MNYMEMNNLLSMNQHGFRNGRGTDTAVMELLRKLFLDIANNEIIDCLFLDYSKAFNNVNHEILLHKLNFYGFDHASVRWMANYLKGRYQRTIVDSVLSEEVKLNCGVFQGAPLGPLLFIIYINDISMMLDKNNVFYNIYADDTVIVNSDISDKGAMLKNQNAMVKIEDWCTLNKIVLNQKKTKHMYIGPDRKNTDNMEELVVGDDTVERVKKFKYLGVLLDDKLVFDKNIESMMNVVNGKIISLARVRKYMDTSTSLLLYKQMILPFLTICVL